MTVVDASVVVRLLLNRPDDGPLHERFSRERHVHAPTLIDAEVTSAVRGLLLSGKLAKAAGVDRAEQMIGDFADLPLVRYPMRPHQRRVLGLRANLTAYDAFYVALAESLGMPLLTTDQKFSRAPAHAAVVETWPPPGT